MKKDYGNQYEKFFNTLWGDDIPHGYLIISTIDGNKKVNNKAFNTTKLSEPYEYIEKLNKVNPAVNIYHSVGLQREQPENGQRGTAENVIAIPGLWSILILGVISMLKRIDFRQQIKMQWRLSITSH